MQIHTAVNGPIGNTKQNYNLRIKCEIMVCLLLFFFFLLMLNVINWTY